MKKIKNWQVINHGIQSESSFRAAGRSGYADGSTGRGMDSQEAMSDALKALAKNDWDVSSETIPNFFFLKIPKGSPRDTHVYISVRVM